MVDLEYVPRRPACSAAPTPLAEAPTTSVRTILLNLCSVCAVCRRAALQGGLKHLWALILVAGPQANGAEAPPKAKPSPAKKDEERPMLLRKDGRFIDYRWQGGRWVLSEFANEKTGEMDWPAWNAVRPRGT